MSAQDVFTNQEAEMLLNKDEEELVNLLALRVNAVNQDVSLSLQPAFDVQGSPFEAVSLPPWIQKNRRFHDLYCRR